MAVVGAGMEVKMGVAADDARWRGGTGCVRVFSVALTPTSFRRSS